MSLETPIGEEEDSHLGDFIPTTTRLRREATSFTLMKEQLLDVLDTGPREERCFACALVLDGGPFSARWRR